jgi:CRISPR-associated protein Csm1
MRCDIQIKKYEICGGDCMSEREVLILGSLLHDIGKFWQRTGRVAEGYEAFTEDDYGRNGAHAKWSAGFVTRYVPERWREAATLCLYHHRPQQLNGTPQERLIDILVEADALSAGIDRERRIGDDRGDPFSELQISLLQTLFLPCSSDMDRPPVSREYVHSLKPLSLDKSTLFPQRLSPTNRSQEYAELWDAFAAEADKILGIHNFGLYLESLYYLLNKYTWCVPSAGYVDYPDIPLFDHSQSPKVGYT